jgi:hypothetical protein
MFNNKGKDILVWINCVVFIIVIGLSTFKGTLKEGALFKKDDELSEEDDDIIGKLSSAVTNTNVGDDDGRKASGQTAEPSDPAIPTICKDGQIAQVEKLYKYYKMLNETLLPFMGPPGKTYNWEKKHELETYIKNNNIDEILKKLADNQYKGVKDKHFQQGIILRLLIDKESQQNAAHMVCNGANNGFPHPDHVEKKKKKNECEYQGMGVWMDDETCACTASTGVSSTPLEGVDKDGNKELTKNGEKNEKYNGKKVKCYCPKKKNGRSYNWDIDDNVCIVKE